MCCTVGAQKGTYKPDSHLHSTTRIPSSDPMGLHPRPTGGPFSEGDAVGIFYALTDRTGRGLTSLHGDAVGIFYALTGRAAQKRLFCRVLCSDPKAIA